MNLTYSEVFVFPILLISEIREPSRTCVDRLRISAIGVHTHFALAILKTAKGIDSGEAEVVAQQKALLARCVISDDKRFSRAIKRIDRHVTDDQPGYARGKAET